MRNPKIVNANPELKEWHTEEYKRRLSGLKFNRTLWVCAIAGGPFEYTAKKLDDAHFNLHISPEIFDEVAIELADMLDFFKVPESAKQEVLDVFSAHKPQVTAGYLSSRA